VKTLLEVRQISEEELPTIFCDMDQVLVDFIGGAEDAIGEPFATADKDQRWNKIANTKGFWANLSWLSGGKRLWDFISKYDTEILSAYSNRDGTSRNGKLKWLSKNTKIKRSKINLVMRSDKQKYATTNGKPNVLIDDYIKNINEWEAKGGIGIHHTNVSKTITELKRLGFK
jgi:hypothetical protein